MTDSKRLHGKVALVTGGGSGIGEATAIAFSREGARVVVADISTDNGEATVSKIEDAGGSAIFVRADVANSTDVQAMIKQAVNAYGQLDCAFNNAGIEGNVGAPLAEYSEDNWDQVININLKGIFLCLKYELQQMLKQNGGAIVNTASVAGLVGGSFGSAYYASKHGVVGLSKAAAVENGQSGIRVNAVCPGVIRTSMAERIIQGDEDRAGAVASLHPMGRLGQAEEVAETVVWLCSDAASFITGQALAVDGGFVAQ